MAFYNTATPDSVYIQPTDNVTRTPEIDKIREWLPWSIINIFIGLGLGGIMPLIFSLLCRNNKRNNDFNGARTMSTLALVFNVIVTLSGIAGWISLIFFIIRFR